MSKHVKLWHRPYNGGWIWFDKTQIKSFRAGWGIKDYDHTGEVYVEPTLWWCVFGFCGRFLVSSMPWHKNPSKKAQTQSE